MAQAGRRLELSQKEHLYWLSVGDGRRFSGSSASELVSLAHSHLGGSPLKLGRGDRLKIDGSIADFAPVLEELRPNVEMTSQLEQAMVSTDALPLFDFGNVVNDARWGWFKVHSPSPAKATTSFTRAHWQLAPQEFAKCPIEVVRLKSNLAGGAGQSALLLQGTIGLAFGKGKDRNSSWASLRYDIEDATEVAREHLNRINIGLPAPHVKAACPYCKTDSHLDSYEISVAPPVEDDVVGEAMARIVAPCRKHLSMPSNGITYQGQPYA